MSKAKQKPCRICGLMMWTKPNCSEKEIALLPEDWDKYVGAIFHCHHCGNCGNDPMPERTPGNPPLD